MGEWLSVTLDIQNIKHIREIIYVPDVLLIGFVCELEGKRRGVLEKK
jgi:hypothetical protein